MKTFFYIILILHALIHLMGFVKGQGWAVQGLQLPISKTAALFWLLTFLLFIGWGISTALRHDMAWILGVLAIILSQLLIFSVWSEAKWGTLLNLFLLLFCWIQFSDFRFQKQWSMDTKLLQTEKHSEELKPLDSLPELVQRWYQQAMKNRKTPIQGGMIQQTLQLKLKPEQVDFNAATAQQCSRISPPAFSWKIDVPYILGMHLYGRDDYSHGKGSMFITLHHLFTIVDASGPKLDEGTAQRFLGELVWFPPLVRSPHIHWEEIDNISARATIDYQGVKGSGVFYFNQKGHFEKFVAKRYYEQNQAYYDWILEVQNQAEFEGVMIPSCMTATWKLPEVDWIWLQLQVDKIAFW